MNQRKAGALLSYISMGVTTIIGFIYIPMLLLFLTKSQYGLYQLIGSIIAYLTIMDFGLANTVTRYYSRYLAHKDNTGKENILAISTILYSIIAIFVIIIGLIVLHYVLPLYADTLSLQDLQTAKVIFIIMLINLAIIIPAHVFTAVINAHEKFVFARSVTITNAILQPVLVLLVLNFKATVISLVIVQTFCNIAVAFINMYYCFKKLNIKIKLHFWNKPLVREVLTFSVFIFLGMIMDQVYWKTGQVILGAVTGTEAVAVYSIAVYLSMAYMSFSTGISNVFLPKLSGISAQTEEMAEINNIFVKTGRIQFLVIFLILSGFILYGKQFIIFWVGNSFTDAYLYSVILMIGLFIPLIQNTAISILQAKNKHAFRSIIYFIIAVLNVLISIPMAKKYGGLGCAITTTVCLFIAQVIIINFYYKNLGIEIFTFFRNIFKMFLPAIFIFNIGYFINIFIEIRNVKFFIVQILFYILIYAIIMWQFAMNDYEKKLILNPIDKILKSR